MQPKRRLEEIYVTTDEVDRLTLRASSLRTHSDDELSSGSGNHCSRHLRSGPRSGPSIHMCWQFDDTYLKGGKSAEVIDVIGKVVEILRGLDPLAVDRELSTIASDSQVNNEEVLINGDDPESGEARSHLSGMNIVSEKERRDSNEYEYGESRINHVVLEKEPPREYCIWEARSRASEMDGFLEMERQNEDKNGEASDHACASRKYVSSKEPQEEYGTVNGSGEARSGAAETKFNIVLENEPREVYASREAGEHASPMIMNVILETEPHKEYVTGNGEVRSDAADMKIVMDVLEKVCRDYDDVDGRARDETSGHNMNVVLEKKPQDDHENREARDHASGNGRINFVLGKELQNKHDNEEARIPASNIQFVLKNEQQIEHDKWETRDDASDSGMDIVSEESHNLQENVEARMPASITALENKHEKGEARGDASDSEMNIDFEEPQNELEHENREAGISASNVSLEKELQKEYENGEMTGHASNSEMDAVLKHYGTKKDDCDFSGTQNHVNRPQDTRQRITSRRKYKACKVRLSRFAETSCTRKKDAGLSNIGTGASESGGPRLLSTCGLGFQGSGVQASDQGAHGDQPEDTKPLEVVHGCTQYGEEAPTFEGLATAGADGVGPFAPGIRCMESKFRYESRSEGLREAPHAHCEIADTDDTNSESPLRFEQHKLKDLKDHSDENKDRVNLSPGHDQHESRELETFNLRTCFEFTSSDTVTDLEYKSTATSLRHEVSNDENFPQSENTKDSSSDSSEDGVSYGEEETFRSHDSVWKENGKKSESDFHGALSRTLRLAMEKREMSSSAGLGQEMSQVPEVDIIFSGPKWKTFNPRVRVKTILDQFSYLTKLYRSRARMRDFIVGRRLYFRPDTAACKYLMARRFCFNEGRSVIGSIPGVEVGDTFTYRAELLILIVHRTPQSKIEYIPASRSGFLDKNGFPAAVAVSIVSSGGYEESEDDGETLTYVGSGGERNLTNHSRRSADCKTGPHVKKDQELVRGNVALRNSCDLGVPVRVVRGEKNTAAGPGGDVMNIQKRSYWYDGLYNVVKYYEVIGSAGSKVWKFQLVRRKGQRESLRL